MERRNNIRRAKYNRKIAVCGKGGSGKSTVAALMARGLQDRGARVLVVDSDESNPGLYRVLGFDQRPIPGPQNRLLESGAPAVAAGQDSVSSRRADSRRRMSIGKANPLRCELVQMRRGYFGFGILAGEITVSHVVGQYVNDVGRLLLLILRPCRR